MTVYEENGMPGYVDPTREAFADFVALKREGPVAMLNLVALHEKAQYKDGRDVSGVDAYAEYGRGAGPVFTRVGGKQIWLGVPELMLIGPAEENWHLAFIAQYPDIEAFVEMVKDPDYQAIVFHRQAAVKDSRLLRLKPGVPGAEFGKRQ
jgi:uncharacterized protein (DUF1330 family)